MGGGGGETISKTQHTADTGDNCKDCYFQLTLSSPLTMVGPI